MAHRQYTTARVHGEHLALPSAKEAHLTNIFGNLHDLIPRITSEMGQVGAADYLTTPTCPISHTWVARWLSRNGYARVVRYERIEGGAQ